MRNTVWAGGFGVAAAVMLAFVCVAAAPRLAVAADAGKKNVTFAKDVAPIFQQKCQVCHHPGAMGPMSLMTYEAARPWARSIRKRVAGREMPPWHIDKTIGIQKYKNDRSLSDEQIATILAWVDAGAPLGNPKDLPPPLQFEDEDQWFIGQPDVIIAAPEHVQYANGPDWWINYETDSGLTEDRYIKAIQTKPSKEGRRVTHHFTTSLKQAPDADREGAVSLVDRTAGTAGAVFGETFLSQFSPNKTGDIFPEGTGRLIKAGSRLRFGGHFFSVGEEIRANIEVGMVLYPKGVVPKYRAENVSIGDNQDEDIPPNSLTRQDAYYRLPKPARIMSWQPHMHMRGKYSCLEAFHIESNPLWQLTSGVQGAEQQTLGCANWDFNWSIPYIYDDDVAPLLPAGTILHIMSIHDNTTNNPRNPDPSLWVGFGQRSTDEMANIHVGTVFLTEEDYQRQVAERKAKLEQAKQQRSTSQQ